MVNSFIEDYLEWVHEALGSPGTQRRKSDPSSLRDLHAHHLSVFERLIKVSNNETVLNYAETNIIITKDQEFYELPGNFRQFIALERRTDGNRDKVVDRYRTVADGDNRRGIVIQSADRGFRVQPLPSETNTYTMRYQKGPIILHWGIVAPGEAPVGGPRADGNAFPLQPGVLPESQGRRVDVANYYKGERIHIIDADTGAGQSREVVKFSPTTLLCSLRSNLSPYPTGIVKYEFRSILPRGYDKLIALSVAVSLSASFTRTEHRGLLKQEFKEMFAAAKNYYRTATVDRPQKARPVPGQSVVSEPFFG